MLSYLDNKFDLNSPDLIEVIDELPYWSAPFGIKLLEAINYKRNITALDIGSGAGFPLTEIALRLGNSCKVHGLDPWEAAMARIEKKLNHYQITNTELIKGYAEEIPFPDDSIDLITSNNGINNVSDLSQTLSECARILKPNGQFVQSINLQESMIEFYNTMEQVLIEKNELTYIDGIREQIYEKRKPLEEFTQELKTHGFTIKKIDKHQFLYSFADGTALLNHYFIRLAFMDGWKSIIPPDKMDAIFSSIENHLNKKADKEGSIKLTIPFVIIDATI